MIGNFVTYYVHKVYLIGAVIVVVLMANLFSTTFSKIRDVASDIANVALPGQPFAVGKPTVTPVPIVNPQQQNVSLQPNISTEFGQGRYNPATGNIELIDSNIRLPGGFSRREGTILPKKELAPGQPFNVPPKPPVKQPKPEIQQTSKEGGFRPEQPKAPEQGAQGVSSGQFSVSDTGVSGISGGQSLLPGSMSSFGRLAGTSGLQNLLTEEERRRGVLVKFKGSPDIFDPNQGKYVSAQDINTQFQATGRPVEVVETDVVRPGIQTEADFSRLAQDVGGTRTVQPLSSAEIAAITPAKLEPDVTDLDKFKKGETEDTAQDILNKLNMMKEAGVTTIDELDKQIKEAAADENRVKAAMRNLELDVLGKRIDIAEDPNFSLRKKAVRDRWLTESPQSPAVLQRIALSNELQAFTDSKKALLDLRKQRGEDIDRNLRIFNALKPDNLKYEVDKNGNMVSFYWDPITQTVKSQAIVGGESFAAKKNEHGDIKNVMEVGSDEVGRKLLITYEDGYVDDKEISKPGGITSPTIAPGTVVQESQFRAAVNRQPVGARENLFGAADVYKQANDLIQRLTVGGVDTGPASGRLQALKAKTTLGGGKEFQEFQASVTQMSASFQKMLSGVAISPQEMVRLEAFLPNVNKQETKNIIDLKNLQDYSNRLTSTRLGFGLDAVYGEFASGGGDITVDLSDIDFKF